MNIQQIQYALALEKLRHFEGAADMCHISQSTLSTMILKLEDELGVEVFDRKQKPLGITKEGQVIIDQLKVVAKELEALHEVVNVQKGEISGDLSIAVIPTVAPYILPLFLQKFASQFPSLRIEVREHTTEEIVRLLKLRELDIGIVSVPITDDMLVEHFLYDEPFVYYDAKVPKKKWMKREDVVLGELCLLENGHCMRNQVLEWCDADAGEAGSKLNFRYRAGCIDGLLRFVRSSQSATLLPWLAAFELPSDEQNRISRFKQPTPYRKIGLLVHKNFVKKKVLELLEKQIKAQLKGKLPLILNDEGLLAPK